MTNNNTNRRRVVVTGLGAITPLGLTADTLWQNLIEGRSGIKRISLFDTTHHKVHIAGEIPEFDPITYVNPKMAKRIDRCLQFGLAAAVQAIEDAGLTHDALDRDRVGVSIGSGMGGISTIERVKEEVLRRGPGRIPATGISGLIINMIAGLVAQEYGYSGPNFSLSTACATGAHSVGLAVRTIQCGDADVMIAGGAEAPITELGIGGFAASRALSQRNDSPETASRPFCSTRDGFVMSEGAGVMVVESLEHALARGARIYCEITGFGQSDDAFNMTRPSEDGSGAARAMSRALQDARIGHQEISYINAHGTSTPAGDEVEVKAIKSVFNGHAHHVPVSSTKSQIGHLLGAAGAVEAIICVQALRHQKAPATCNIQSTDADCDLDFIRDHARNLSLTHAMSNSFGFGGTNVSLVFSQLAAV